MTANITVKSDIERSYGKQSDSGLEKYEVRFWLEVIVNGRTIQSRGTTRIIEVPSLGDARDFLRGASFIEMSIGNDNLDAKAAEKKLPEYVQTLVDMDGQWKEITKLYE